jgi:hypothetical protein
MNASDLSNLAEKCREIVQRAQADLGVNLGGFSALDLVADQLSAVPLEELDAALKLAGIPHFIGSRR